MGIAMILQFVIFSDKRHKDELTNTRIQ